MVMPWAQYLRIERIAGGVSATPRQFIRAALSLMTPDGRSRHHREARHAWLRHGLAHRTAAREAYRLATR